MLLREVDRLVAATDPDWRWRGAAILALLADTVTTLYVLYMRPLPAGELNPLGAFMQTHGMAGDVLFMAVPLFSVLLFLYLPGILGDAVALTNVPLHAGAAAINLVHATGTPLQAAVGVGVVPAYIFLVTFSVGLGTGWAIPHLRQQPVGP